MKQINSQKAPLVTTGYSQAIEIGKAQRTLFISGQIPVDQDGQVSKRVSEQA